VRRSPHRALLPFASLQRAHRVAQAMRGDWKSADEIEADLESGDADQKELIAGLWHRVDELEAKLADLDRRLKSMPSN
jgi:hypothetical protein